MHILDRFKIHERLTLILILAMTCQGFFVNLRIVDQPLWAITLLFFTPFVPKYLNFFFQLPWQLKLIYFSLCFAISIISYNAIFINGGIANIDRLIVPSIGIYLSLILLYNYQNKINLFIKHILFLITIMGLFSVLQFFFEIKFFEFFLRKMDTFNEAGELILRNRDQGSSGTFGYPVPYGYFLGFFCPIIYSYSIKHYPKYGSVLKKILYFLLPILMYFSLLLSMQRGAILVVLVSILVISLFAFNLKRALIIFILLPLSTQIIFNGMQGEYSRILNADNLKHNQMFIETKGTDSKYKGGKVLFDMTAIYSRFDIVYTWHKAIKNYKNTKNQEYQAVTFSEMFKIPSKAPNTYEMYRQVYKDVKGRDQYRAYSVPETPHSYMLVIDMNYGRVALVSVLISYFLIAAPILWNLYIVKKTRFESVAFIMAGVSYLSISFVHNNGHFLLDSVGWIGIGLLLVYINDFINNSKQT
jgi:hypothetical protein